MGIKLNRISFMVVDDNAHMRVLLRRVLRGLGSDMVVEAADGSAALMRMEDDLPDILILDWVMAPMDGLDLTRFIRKSAESPNPYMPIIMMTGFADRDRVFQARDAGVNEFVVKPLAASTLFSRIGAIIERPRPFVRVGEFFGPDRRRRKTAWTAEERRGQAGGGGPRPAANAVMSQKEINELFNPT